jgi:hypothetical protein
MKFSHPERLREVESGPSDFDGLSHIDGNQQRA